MRIDRHTAHLWLGQIATRTSIAMQLPSQCMLETCQFKRNSHNLVDLMQCAFTQHVICAPWQSCTFNQCFTCSGQCGVHPRRWRTNYVQWRATSEHGKTKWRPRGWSRRIATLPVLRQCRSSVPLARNVHKILKAIRVLKLKRANSWSHANQRWRRIFRKQCVCGKKNESLPQ